MASLQNRWNRAVNNPTFTYATSSYNQGMITAWKKKRKKTNRKKSNSGPHFSEQSIGDDTKQCDSPPIFISPFLNCWLGERHSQMMVFTKVIIMQINQGLDGFFHCCHLKESHFVISLKKLKCFHSAPSVSKQRSEILFCYWRRDIG